MHMAVTRAHLLISMFAEESAAKRKAERIAEADMRGSNWLAKGNEYAEQGKKAQAEKCYAKGQFWLDRSNKLRGAGELPS